MFLTFTTREAAVAALAVINSNMKMPITGIDAQTHQPEPEAQKTETWNNLTKAYNQDLWYFAKPNQEYMSGVVDFLEQEFDQNWLEPAPEL